MKKKTLAEAIRDREQFFKLIQMELQQKIAEYELQLVELNSQIGRVAYETTSSMLYDILQDRAKEVVFGHKIYRY